MKKFFVIGSPIKHSLSPELHNYWIKNNGINAIYEKQKLNENELKSLILNIKKKKIKWNKCYSSIQKKNYTIFRYIKFRG